MAKKLFQHIPQGDGFKGLVDKMVRETAKVFQAQGGHSLLAGMTRTYRPLNEDGQTFPSEAKKRVTTVMERLNWTVQSLGDQLDWELTRDTGNMSAKADLIVDGTVVAQGVPATFLLALERRFMTLRAIYNAIPTLDLSLDWEDVGGGVFKHGPEVTHKTDKKSFPIRVAEATPEHKEQVIIEKKDIVIGEWDAVQFSGAVHPGLKAALLERVDAVIAAAKDARYRANDVEVTDMKVGKALFDWIHQAEQK